MPIEGRRIEDSRPAPVESRPPFDWSGAGLALLCAMLWGGNSVAVKLSVDQFPPLLTCALRFALAGVATGFWSTIAGASLRVQRDQVPLIAANGLLLFAQIGLFTVGTAKSTSLDSVILINVYPFFTAIITHYWLPQFPLQARQLVGLAVAFLGVAVMFAEIGRAHV